MGACRSPSPPLLLLLLPLVLAWLPRTAAAPSQGSSLSLRACRSLSSNDDEAFPKCCYRCPAGYEQKTGCPTDRQSGCVKVPCKPDYYLNNDLEPPQCEACVSCPAERHLVETSPCTANSSRACECQPGWYCRTLVKNTCSRCIAHTTCERGSGVKTRGNSVSDTVCEKCPPGTFSDLNSSTQICKPNTEYEELNKVTVSLGTSTHDKRALDKPTEYVGPVAPATTTGLPLGPSPPHVFGTTIGGPTEDFNVSHVPGVVTLQKRSRRDDGSLAAVGAVALSVFALFVGMVMLRRRRSFKEWIIPHKAKISNHAKMCAKRIEALSFAESGPGERELMNPGPLMEAEDDGGPLTGKERAPSLEPNGGELVQVGELVPLGLPPRSCANNHIEKVYIMRAETVIVGSVSEVPSGKTCPAREEEERFGTREGVEETDLAMHYPEQETEFCPGSDITTPVEEEWEFHQSTEKMSVI